MHSFAEALAAHGRIVARLGTTTRLVVLLTVASLVAAACSGTPDAESTGAEDLDTVAESSPPGASEDGDQPSAAASSDRAAEVLAAQGSGADVITLTGFLPAADEFGSDWVEVGSPGIEEFFPCEKPPARTSVGRIFASFSPDTIFPGQINLYVIELLSEADAIKMFDTMIGEGADDCDLVSADTLEAQLAAATGGAYSLDRSTIIGEPDEPLIELPDGFDAIGGRSYGLRYLGDSDDIELEGDLTVLRRRALILVAGDLTPSPFPRNDSTLKIFVEFARELGEAGWGDESRTDASDTDRRDELDAAGHRLTSMMALDNEVPARYESLFRGELLPPPPALGCDEPDPAEIVAVSEGPGWHATSGQVGEQIVQRGYVFVSATSAEAFVDRHRSDLSCFTERNLLSRQQLQLPVAEVEVSLHNTVVDGIDILELRATGKQILADVELVVVNSVFLAREGNAVTMTLYIGLLGDEQEIAAFTASAAKRGGEGP